MVTNLKKKKLKKEILKVDFKPEPREKTDIKINKDTAEIQRIVIIGGGFAGVRAALDLSKKIKNAEIKLIDKNDYHSYHPDYYEIASAILNSVPKQECVSDVLALCKTVAIPYSMIFQGDKKIEFIKSEVVKIDFKNSVVETADKNIFYYNWLIVSSGSKTSFYDIPGLKSAALEFKTVNDALNIRNALCEIFSNKAKREKIDILIGGAGFTGSEVTGEIANYIKYLCKSCKRPKNSYSLKIVEASQNILGGASQWARKKSKKRLEKLGAEIILNVEIEKIEPAQNTNPLNDEHLSLVPENSKGKMILKNGQIFPFDILIWTAGVEASEISKLFPEDTLQKKFCLKTDKFLRVLPYENIFAAGDIAYYVNEKTENPLPMTAQTAMSEGKYAAYAISQKINLETADAKLKPYKPAVSKFIIPLGGKYALADLDFIKFSGFLAWSLKHMVTLHYFLKILPFSYALKIWLSGMRIYIKNDRV